MALGLFVAVPAWADFRPDSEAEWSTAFDAGDAAAIAAMYTEDAWLLPPNEEIQSGRAAVQQSWADFIATGLALDLEEVESAFSGDLGYKIGRYVLSTPDGTEVDRGKYMEVWKRVKGQWLIHRDTWNSSLPAAEPTGEVE